MDPFSSKHIFRLETTYLKNHNHHDLKLDINTQDDYLALAKLESAKVPALTPEVLKLSLDEVSLDSLDASQATPSVSESGDDTDPKNSVSNAWEYDIWDTDFLSQKGQKNNLLSWDTLKRESEDILYAKYISEAGASTFDAIVSRFRQSENGEDCDNVRLDRFLQTVLNALLGRSSLLFQWNGSLLQSQIHTFKLPGYSVALTGALSTAICDHGMCFGNLRRICKSSLTGSATAMAVQSALERILDGIETSLLRHISTKTTLVKVQTICIKLSEIYEVLNAVVARVQESTDEASLVAATLSYIDQAWFSQNHLRAILTELAKRILQPGIEATWRQVKQNASSPGLGPTDKWILEDALPECRSTFLEIVRCLKVGNENGMLVQSIADQVSTVKLAHQWLELLESQSQTDSLERDIRSFQIGTLVAPKKNTDSNSRPFGEETGMLPDLYHIDPQLVPSKLAAFHQQHASDVLLNKLVQDLFIDSEEQALEAGLSPAQMLDMSLRPLLIAQHRACSYTLLKSLFLHHDLLAHLEMLHAFSLLGDGSFAARLSRALFDADEYSAEGRRKSGLTAGLRLENRDVWPPASSELRLVLMGLLSESSFKGKTNLLDSISFAIRDLSDDEMELCRDMHSIHALDFLRLSYTVPNSVLELVNTPSIVEKYDRVFKYLLVLLRMHAFTQSLLAKAIKGRSSHNESFLRFRWDLHHFVSGLLDYALNVAIHEPWTKMFKHFTDVHKMVLTDDYHRCMSLAGSMDQLRKIHEDALDEMLSALLLKKKQAKIFLTTCKIFSVGLNFAKEMARPSGQDLTKQYAELRQNLELWFKQAAQATYGDRSASLQRLNLPLVRMDFAGYYGPTRNNVDTATR